MTNDLFDDQRKSYMAIGEIYFWTATLHRWLPLLKTNQFKDIIIRSWKYLTDLGKIDVFAFVIMPNHIHMIWRMNEKNGKESAHGSFLKYTAHEFMNLLKKGPVGDIRLEDFIVDKTNKNHEFWQRDSLAIRLYSWDIAVQKMEYIHLNPLQEHWSLVTDPCDYKYSTARYYENGSKDFDFIRDLRDEF